MKKLLCCISTIIMLLLPAVVRAQGYGESGWPASEIIEKCDPFYLGSIDPAYLRIMRNAIYATYGRPFEAEDLKKFFAGEDWYKEDPDYNDGLLTAKDKTCIEKIKKAEDDLNAKIAASRGKERVASMDALPNAQLFGDISPDAEKKLLANGFVILPTKDEQLFYIYENNAYRRIPNFVTTDSVLQLYHVFFDFSLRKIEEKHLLPAIVKYITVMFGKSLAVSSSKAPDQVRRAAAANAAYFAVAGNLLGAKLPVNKLPKDQQTAVKKELDKIKKHSGRADSSLFPYKVDYSQFIPRGHYTRSEKLKKFFLGMMWLGNTLFAIGDDKSDPKSIEFNKKYGDMLLVRSLLISMQMHDKSKGAAPIDLWHSVYDITSFFVGVSDDLTPVQVFDAGRAVYGANFKAENLWSADKIKRARSEILKKISAKIIVTIPGIPNGPQMRVMGQRYIPDSEMLQKLVTPIKRPVPKGLDVMAVLGSATAKDLLLNFYKEQNRWPEFPQRLEKLIKDFSKVTSDEWRQNMYYGWLWTLQAQVAARVEGKVVPYYVNAPAWQKKNLNTALGSWAELRHDTILYGKQSGTECGDGGEFVNPPVPRGAVELNPEFFTRLETLTKLSIEGLKRFGYLDEQEEGYNTSMKDKYESLLDLISFLKIISNKQLDGKALSKGEYQRINGLGADLEWLTLSLVEPYSDTWELVNETDRFMAVVADVHTAAEYALEEGVGFANEMLIIAPIDGVPYLMRGPVFSYYEFLHPVSDRLTDEKWQKMLKQDKAPDPPKWFNDIFVPKKRAPSKGKIFSGPKC